MLNFRKKTSIAIRSIYIQKTLKLFFIDIVHLITSYLAQCCWVVSALREQICESKFDPQRATAEIRCPSWTGAIQTDALDRLPRFSYGCL